MSRNVKAERDLIYAAKQDLTKGQELKQKANKQYMIDYYEKRKQVRQATSDRQAVDEFMGKVGEAFDRRNDSLMETFPQGGEMNLA